MAEESAILEELRGLRSDLDRFRSDFDAFKAETRTSFRGVKNQLNTLEFGILTIAQKLLHPSEQEEIRERMSATG